MHLTNFHFFNPKNYLYSNPVKVLQGYRLGYGFGFNGKERDNETYGEENAYDFGARIYDDRLGRWFKTDLYEAAMPHLTSYSFVENNPINYCDKGGNFKIDPKDAEKYKNLKPAIASVLAYYKLPENEEKLKIILKFGEFKNKEEFFEILTDDHGPTLKIADLIDFKTTSIITDKGFTNNTDITTTMEGKLLGLSEPAIGLTVTSYQPRLPGNNIPIIDEEVVYFDDALANATNAFMNKKGNVKIEFLADMFNAVVVHEGGHVGDNRDGKTNSAPGAGSEVGKTIENKIFGEQDFENEIGKFEPTK